MNPLDLALAAVGGLAFAVERALRRSRRAVWALIVGLVVVSAIPVLIIGSSARPTDVTFADVSQELLPPNTTWVRMEGNIRTSDGLIELHDPADDARYVIVIPQEEVSYPPGPTTVTGHISPRRATSGNAGTIDADVPAVPRVDDPFWLYLAPALFAVLLVIGIRLGYPVVRQDRPARRSGPGAAALAPGEPLTGRWTGRIGSRVIPPDQPIACSVTVTPTPDLADLSDLAIVDATGTHTARVRRHASPMYVRTCRITGCEPGLVLRPTTADIILTFADGVDRDRLAATLR